MRRILVTLTLLASLFLTASVYAIERARGPLLRGEALQTAADSMWRDIGQASWIRDGDSRHVMYVFFDPNCPYCRRVYYNARDRVEFGDVEMRWIPIGVMIASSPGKAAAMLESSNPTEALHRNEHEFTNENRQFGGIKEIASPRPETLAKLARNLELLRRSGMDAVPSLLFRTKAGQVRFVVGAPPEETLKSIIDDLE